MKITDNTVLITGGTGGIGFELAKQLIALGNTVIVTGRDQARLEAAQQKLPGLQIIKSDVASSAAIRSLHEQAIQKFPALNIVINNAGIMKKVNLHDPQNLDELTTEIDTNLVGTVRMVSQFLPHLKSRKNAAIMNVSSGLAFVPFAISPIYSATKAAVHSYSLSLRVQLKKTSVRVFELAPPVTETAMVDAFDREDMEGTKAMTVEALASEAIAGMRQDRFEIRPGQSNLLQWMSRIAPSFILGQLSKSADRMIGEPKLLGGAAVKT
ncbi:MAG: SDR family NAD(P)-dependent oxidoreductase [Polyangiaceae bacterium]